jgi:hypothetical protein
MKIRLLDESRLLDELVVFSQQWSVEFASYNYLVFVSRLNAIDY